MGNGSTRSGFLRSTAIVELLLAAEPTSDDDLSRRTAHDLAVSRSTPENAALLNTSAPGIGGWMRAGRPACAVADLGPMARS